MTYDKLRRCPACEGDGCTACEGHGNVLVEYESKQAAEQADHHDPV